MKKIITMVMICMLLVMCAACGGQEKPSEEPKQTTETTPAAEPGEDVAEPAEEVNEDPYYFAADGTEIRIMDEADPILAALGEPASTFEADSCAFQGKDYFYYYDGFQLMVNDVEGVNRITSITLVDDTVKAPQGIGIGSKEEEIAGAFGEDFTKASEMYVYRHDTTSLQISVKSGKVTAMVYAYAVAN